MKLVDANGQDAQYGKQYPDFRGELCILVDARPPHKASSTGRVYVKSAFDATPREYFPGVIGMKWVEA